jgi:hypothetical protein
MSLHRSQIKRHTDLVSEVTWSWRRVIGLEQLGMCPLAYQAMTFAGNPAPNRSRFKPNKA